LPAPNLPDATDNNCAELEPKKVDCFDFYGLWIDQLSNFMDDVIDSICRRHTDTQSLRMLLAFLSTKCDDPLRAPLQLHVLYWRNRGRLQAMSEILSLLNGAQIDFVVKPALAKIVLDDSFIQLREFSTEVCTGLCSSLLADASQDTSSAQAHTLLQLLQSWMGQWLWRAQQGILSIERLRDGGVLGTKGPEEKALALCKDFTREVLLQFEMDESTARKHLQTMACAALKNVGDPLGFVEAAQAVLELITENSNSNPRFVEKAGRFARRLYGTLLSVEASVSAEVFGKCCRWTIQALDSERRCLLEACPLPHWVRLVRAIIEDLTDGDDVATGIGSELLLLNLLDECTLTARYAMLACTPRRHR
jgi:hypothetical protein